MVSRKTSYVEMNCRKERHRFNNNNNNNNNNNDNNNNNFINLLKKAVQLNLQCQISKT